MPAVADQFTRVMSLLKGVSRAGNSRVLALCPAHADTNPSLSVSQGRDGRALVYCFAGCPTDSIVRALGLTMADLFCHNQHDSVNRSLPAPSPHLTARKSKPRKVVGGPRRKVATYDYLNRMGDWCYAIDRWEGAGKEKSFSIRPKGIPKEDRILYRLNELSDADDPVLIPEGEGKADVLVSLGYTATACPFGADSWLSQYAISLRGRDVVVWPDKDDAGTKFAQNVVNSLRSVSKSVNVVTPPEWLCEGGDVIDLVKGAIT
jgi:putative DNA primase/helicase